MYVRRAAGLWICITCVLDVFVYGRRDVPNGPWQLAFKVVGGKWDGAAVGHSSFWQLFLSSDTYTSSTVVQDKRDFTSNTDHYKATIVEDWENKLISVQAVKLSFFKNNVEKAYIVFGGIDRTKSSVFFCDNILYSSYTDLNADNTLGQQCPGASPMTGFPLTIMQDSYWHTVCSLTTAWTVVADANVMFSVCTSYAPADGSLPTPYFKYSNLSTVAGDLNNNLEQADSIGIFFQVWDLVFKGIEAIKPADSLLKRLTDLYESDTTENDNSNTTIRNLIHAQSSKIFKSDIVNRWADYNVDAVKFSMLKSGSEKAYVIFDGINTNSTSWFGNGTLLYSSYGTNIMGTNLSVCSIQGDTYRNWQIQTEAVEGDCSVWTQRGWMLVKEPRANGSCVWDNSRKKPYFLFNPNQGAASPSVFYYADVMAVFVHGWRLVFKVSTGDDLGKASSVLDLWLNHGSMNEANETVNLTSSPSPYKSHVAEQWETHYIYAVKLAAYRDGEEVFYAVFDATTSSSSVSWMDCGKLLYTSAPQLNSSSGYTCDISGDVFHFYIGKDWDCSSVSGSAMFAVVDIDSQCSTRSDLPQFLFSNTLDTTLTENSIDNLADTMAIYVDMENCYEDLCENGGTCQDIAGNYRCFCVADFYGPTCANLDGSWSLWTVWSICGVTCGSGVSVRTRDCEGAKGRGGCEGEGREEQPCTLDPCPVDGGYTDWTEWTVCTKTCGKGNQSRSRDCTNPAPQHGGLDCSGLAAETQDCNTHPCPIHGGYTDWTEWSSCTQTCGTGNQSRSRDCANPAPQHGGIECVGPSTEYQNCNTNPCPVDGEFTDWSVWSGCSLTCGTGNQSRSRDCTNPAPQHGGADCVGENEENQTCNEDPCPIDGGFTEWAAWTTCTLTCGSGTRSRSRTCTEPVPQYGGVECQGDHEEIQDCNTNPCPINGGFTLWTEWAECTKTCGAGSSSRYRDCTNPAPQYGGTDCEGETTDTRACNTDPCPVDGGYTEWTKWGDCTRSCGTGSQSRLRDCTNPAPQHGGNSCHGDSFQIQLCNIDPCPIDGGFSMWTDWDTCTQSCETGNQSRSRDCTSPAPQYGGLECTGHTLEIQECNTFPCPIDGGYTDWTDWTSCTQTCGTGNQTRTRNCSNPAPQYDGADCTGESEETQTCNSNPCPIHGGFSDWSEWTVCSQTCGTGNQSKSRQCSNPTPQHGGADCVGESEETQTCNENPCPIDGGYTDWTNWSNCTHTCGTGNQSRSRDCTNPNPQHGGAECVGENEETQTCNEHPCPIDGAFTEWTEWSLCTKTCGTGNQSRSRDCTNPAPQHGGADCVGENEETQTCNEHPCPIDGGFTEWTEWGPCTKTCGIGNQSRSRDCTNPAPQHGGADCVGDSEETQTCNEHSCPINGGFTDWTDWNSCSQTCGTGHQSRSRKCTNPAPQHGGAECVGESEETQTCNEHPCPIDGGFIDWGQWSECTVTCGSGIRSRSRTCTNPPPQYGGQDCVGASAEIGSCNNNFCPIDGAYTDWTDWNSCSQTCGTANQFRSRDCTNPAPQYGGADCVGKSEETQTCNEHPCPIAGGYTDWTDWSSCSQTCGTGNQSRSRDCINPAPQHGGADCVGENEETQTCNEHPCPITTTRSTMKLFGEDFEDLVQNYVDGGYTDWTEWGPCSQTCEVGNQSRSRYCSNPAPQYGGLDCEGEALAIQTCDEGPCPIDGGYTQWTPWGECTLTCGGGTYTRSRDCTDPIPQYGGAECVGQPLDSSACNTQPCPIDGEFSSWTAWSVCTAFCGPGIQLRSRSCSNPPPQYGGADCIGDLVQAQMCQLVPCPISGGWSYWSNWDPCSESCGSGLQVRSRTCTMPSPQHGGDPCTGDVVQSQECNDGTCPVDGIWSAWLPWNQCSETCGRGTHERLRVCEGPFFGGTPCSGESEQTTDCNMQNCPPEDGSWSTWSDWSSCSATCGNGIKTRGRNCSLPNYGGQECSGEEVDTTACRIDECPVDGFWLEWSIWTICTETCGGGIQGRTRICSEPKHGGIPCQGQPSEITMCNPHDCQPVDGGWTEWSEWTQCSKTCGTGDQTRSRSCSDPEPEWDGEDCHGNSQETLYCNTFVCPVDGQWSEWSEWSQCNNMTNNRCTEACLCGRGQRSRLRLCNNPTPNENGQPCQGHSNELKACNNPCADFQCDPVNNPQFCYVKRRSSHGIRHHPMVELLVVLTILSLYII